MMLSRRMLLTGTAGAALGVLAGCAEDTAPEPAASSAAATSATASPASPSSSSVSPTPSTASTAPSTAPSTTPSASKTQAPTGPPEPRVSGTIADDLDVPWGIVFLRSGDALVGERNAGRLKRIAANGKVSTVGDVRGVVAPSGLGEGGLLGLAFAPGDEGTLFAYITTGSDNRVVRFDVSRRSVGKPTVVLAGIPTSTHHHGGKLLFDDDGMLLVSTGDAENSALAQQKGSLAGKILRLRPDGRAAAGNPYGNRTWTYGHRNVEGMSFDAKGRLWATEFGDKKADELNLVIKGKNYGWPVVEGRSSSPRFVSPRATWSPTSTCSPAGIAITRSTAFIGALQGKCLFTVALDGTRAGKPKAHFAGEHGRIRNVVRTPGGALWMTTSNTDGRVTPGKHDDKILEVTL